MKTINKLFLRDKGLRGTERLLQCLIYDERSSKYPDLAQVEFLRQVMVGIREDINRLETEIQGEIYE